MCTSSQSAAVLVSDVSLAAQQNSWLELRGGGGAGRDVQAPVEAHSELYLMSLRDRVSLIFPQQEENLLFPLDGLVLQARRTWRLTGGRGS